MLKYDRTWEDGWRLNCSGTFLLHLEVLRQQFVLSVAQTEGHQGQDEGVHDADDGQDVSPAHRAVAQGVFVRALATHALHLIRVPAVRVDHAANHHARAWGKGVCVQDEGHR